MSLKTPVIVAAALLLAACGQPRGTVYPLPMAQAQQRLLAAGLPPLVFGTEPPPFEVSQSGPDIAWIVRRDGVELFRYIAHLSAADGGGTRVTVELEGPGQVDQRLAEKPEIRDLYLTAINEQIAATLESRAFDEKRLYAALTRASLANMGELQASADQAAAASEAEARSNIEKAYADEAAGRR